MSKPASNALFFQHLFGLSAQLRLPNIPSFYPTAPAILQNVSTFKSHHHKSIFSTRYRLSQTPHSGLSHYSKNFKLHMETPSSSTSDGSQLKIALCQVSVGSDKTANLNAARTVIATAAKERGANLIMLPECFNSPYNTKCFPEYAEILPEVGAMEEKGSESAHMLMEAAKQHGVYIVGGSVPERGNDEKFYNTCLAVDPSGKIVAKHRKVHLFDIDVPNGIRFMESETLSAGSNLNTSVFELGSPWNMKIGIMICYDVRFPETSMILSQQGCKLLCIPGAFNMTTGPAHWELLLRARALDNQLYVAACSPARDLSGKGYTAWGHSTVVGPWGDVISTTEHQQDIVYADLDLSKIESVRNSIPTGRQKRNDIYELKQVQ